MGPRWSDAEVRAFFEAFHTHGPDWAALSSAVGTRSAAACEAVHTQCAPFLSIPRAIQSAEGLGACLRAIYDAEGAAEGAPGGGSSRRGSEAGGSTPRRPPGAVPAHVPQPVSRGRRTTTRRARPKRKQQAYIEVMLGGGGAEELGSEDEEVLERSVDRGRKRFPGGSEGDRRVKRHRSSTGGGSRRRSAGGGPAPAVDAEAVDMLLMLGAAAESGKVDSPAKGAAPGRAPRDAKVPVAAASEPSSSGTTASVETPPQQVRARQRPQSTTKQ